MRINRALWSLFLLTSLVSLVFVSPVSAGGQLVSLYADTDGWVSDTMYGRVLRVYLHPEYPCKGTQITFKFVGPKDGDYITTGSGNSTYVMQEDRRPYYKNGILATTCSTYAKLGSKASEERQVTVEVKNGDSVWADPPIIKVHFDGQYHADNESNGYSYRSSIDDPYFTMPSNPTPIPQPTPEGSIYVKVGTQRYIDGPKRMVYLSWNQVKNVVKYNVYVRLADSRDYGAAIEGTGSLSTQVGINAFLDYYVKVDACSNPGVCISSNEVFVPAMNQVTPAPKPSPPEGNFYVKVGVQRYVGGPKRYVYLSWNQVQNTVKYNVYARLSDMKEYGAATVGTGSLSTEIGINAFLDYYAKVNACNSAGCISSSEVFVPRMKKEEGETIVVPSPSTVIITPSADNSNVEELNKKVENLQNQLDQSKKTQSVLEQRINELVSFIKRFFPLFR